MISRIAGVQLLFNKKMTKTLTAQVAASDFALRHAVKEDELRARFPAMSGSRPHLQEPQLFVAALPALGTGWLSHSGDTGRRRCRCDRQIPAPGKFYV
jgi:hypothetical protein